MFEKVSMSHPDKIADRIAGALVDLAYTKQDNPKIAVEVLLGHGNCFVIAETSVHNTWEEVAQIVSRIVQTDVSDRLENELYLRYVEVPQDIHLANNQSKEIRCGDNGIFKGVPLTKEQIELGIVAKQLYARFPYDGKYIINDNEWVICQSNANEEEIKKELSTSSDTKVLINPLGYWTGGIDVDSGATNRKLGSDMADSVTGGGLHGKDLSKADVSVNIWCWMMAQRLSSVITAYCSIGNTEVQVYRDGEPFRTVQYSEIVEFARKFMTDRGGFEKFAEWGL